MITQKMTTAQMNEKDPKSVCIAFFDYMNGGRDLYVPTAADLILDSPTLTISEVLAELVEGMARDSFEILTTLDDKQIVKVQMIPVGMNLMRADEKAVSPKPELEPEQCGNANDHLEGPVCPDCGEERISLKDDCVAVLLSGPELKDIICALEYFASQTTQTAAQRCRGLGLDLAKLHQENF